MDLKRNFLIVGLAVVCLLLWQEWLSDHNKAARETAQQASVATKASSSHLTTTSQAASSASAYVNTAATASGDRLITVTTDVMSLSIDSLGSNVVNVALLKYPATNKDKNTAFELLNNKQGSLYVAQSGIAKNIQQPAREIQFTSLQKAYTLGATDKTLNVVLKGQGPDGITVTKTFIFKSQSYKVDVDFELSNPSAQAWNGSLFAQLLREPPQQQEASMFSIHSYTGAAISSPEKPFKKVSFSDMSKANLSQQITGGWVAMLQHYFVSAWIPPTDSQYHYYTQRVGQDTYMIGLNEPITVAANGTLNKRLSFYAGPADPARLKPIAHGLELTVDYGWFSPISMGLFWVMQQLHKLVGNWGWSIVLVTFLIKLAFFQLSASAYRSMAAMRVLQPKVKNIQERYADDKQKASQAVIELYRKEKVNPIGGCLPMLIQIPVFIALYWVLFENVAFRQAPFIGWISDLSVHDPYYVLPLLMGIFMFVQQKMNPPPPDPMQAKVMMALPIIMTIFFLKFPSGLVLYWVTNSILSIAQQWYITRRIEMNKVQGGGGNPSKHFKLASKKQ